MTLSGGSKKDNKKCVGTFFGNFEDPSKSKPQGIRLAFVIVN